MDTQTQKVRDFILKKQLVPAGEKLVAAVSGGPDSVCLLYILAELRDELGIELHIAHLDHQLRGRDSDADAKYVAGLARRLGLPATIASRDVKAYREERGLSLEEAAREVRYDFLVEVAEDVGAALVAVGHTADDHAETVLMHLLRGSGTRGLRGLLPVSRWRSEAGEITIIRPLLVLGRRDTIAFCRWHHLRPRTDMSNLSPVPLRNRVRRSLLPELKKYNPAINEALLRTAAIAADDYAFVEKEVDRRWLEIAREQDGAVIINKKGLLALSPALKRYLLRRAVGSVLGSLKDIEAGHIEDVLDALDKPAGKVIVLPFGLSFVIEYDRFILSKESVSLCPFPALAGETTLHVPGVTRLPGWLIRADIISPAGLRPEEQSDDFSACFDFARTGGALVVRSRLPGDRFQPLGMAQPKKLNAFMIGTRIPRQWRRRVPVVVSPERIIWVVGYRIDERSRVTGSTKKVLRLEFKPD